MATPTYWELEKESYPLADDHNLIIRVIEQQKRTRTEGEAPNIRNIIEYVDVKVHECKVNRDTLTEASLYFKKLFDGPFRERQQSVIDLKEDCAEAAQGVIIWLKILHHVKFTYAVIDIRAVWEMLAAAHKYGLDSKSKAARTWFESWYSQFQTAAGMKRLDFDDYRALLFPCHTFDHAEGFAKTTKFLVYHAIGHIGECRPDGFTHDHLRLDQIIIQQLNAAKGRLKTILHRKLYDPIFKLLKYAECDDKEKVLYAYEKALTNTGSWPLETAYLKQSMFDILRNLRTFPNAAGEGLGEHEHCRFSFAATVDKGSDETARYFHGLCLDCMNGSKFGDADEDYWRHAGWGVRWDRNCRIHHDQPTWYFSFMGRREKMIKWTERDRNEY